MDKDMILTKHSRGYGRVQGMLEEHWIAGLCARGFRDQSRNMD